MNIKDNAFAEALKINKKITLKSWKCSAIEEKKYNFEFNAIKNSNKFKVQVYFGKKGVKKVIQGNSDLNEFRELNSLVNNQQKLEFVNKLMAEPDEYIGADESGKGDVFGPLVLASFFTDKKTSEELLEIGVADSKELSDYQIKNIFYEIEKRYKDRYFVSVLAPENYNKLYNSVKNLNKMLELKHLESIFTLDERVNCGTAVLDKFMKRKINQQAFSTSKSIKIIEETKAERFTGVAAASIIARFYFIDWFKKYPKLKLPLGASFTVENKVKNLIQQDGIEELNKIAKMHFKTITKFR